MRPDSRLVCLYCCAATVVLVGFFNGSTASAYVHVSPEAQAAIDDGSFTAAVEIGGETSHVVSCTGTCQALVDAEQATSVESASGGLAVREEFQALREAALVTKPWSGVSPVALGATAFWAGWQLGSFARKHWMTHEQPPAPSDLPCPCYAKPVKKGQMIASNSSAGTVKAPHNGFALRSAYLGGSEFIYVVDPSYSSGIYYPTTFTVPNWEHLDSPGTTAVYPPGHPNGTQAHLRVFFRPWAYGPKLIYSGQAVTEPVISSVTPEPTPTQVDLVVKRELSANPDTYENLIRWLNYTAGQPNACDPMNPSSCNPDDESDQDECDLTPHATELDNPSSDQFDIHDAFSRTEFDLSPVETALKYGDTSWGYRHVAPSHGWGPADVLQTDAALGLPPSEPSFPGSGTVVYTGPSYTGTNSAECYRRVVVQILVKAGEPSPREIITSYGRNRAND